ncbi:MAG: alcohol dehydrogenase catalytic domain-containing protein [Syntrophobacterales bacterium]|nr:alcohol dehydrogenase catalytic domain-containing protein [Syntrophobacterales bacterium]
MKAVIYRHDRGLTVEEVPIPEEGDDFVVVRVVNTGFCGSDHSLIESGFLAEGTILGHETSGVVAGFGKRVEGIHEGMRIIIRPTFCGGCRECLRGMPHLCSGGRRTIGIGDLPGGFAEYLKIYPQMAISIPDGVDSRNAALAEPFAVALHGIKTAGSAGGSVLVMGGGAIGLASVRILKILGYFPIVLSEPVAEKRMLGAQLGADFLIDPFSENLSEKCTAFTNGVGFDTILECSGIADNISVAIELAAKGGRICMISIIFKGISIAQPMYMNFKEISFTGAYSNTHEENRICLQWMAEKKLDALPLITDLISLHELPDIYEKRIKTGKALKVMLKIGQEF